MGLRKSAKFIVEADATINFLILQNPGADPLGVRVFDPTKKTVHPLNSFFKTGRRALTPEDEKKFTKRLINLVVYLKSVTALGGISTAVYY